jgi:flagellin-like hook-associated protein FlgL
MALVVNNNIPALQTYNALTATTNSLQKSIQKLSSGLRINSAADDAAGLAISEKMRAQIRGLDRAVSNSQDGISMIQTAEGALSETHSILQRMRELSVQAANDTLTQQDRGYIQLEIDQLREEVTRIGNTTQFNKKKLLDGSAAVLWSSDNLTTKAIINGGLRTIDQFGQKNAAEGNYKITVKATPGQAEVQKTDVLKVKHAGSTQVNSTSRDREFPDIEIGVAQAESLTPLFTGGTAPALTGATFSDNLLEGFTFDLNINAATGGVGYFTREDGSHGTVAITGAALLADGTNKVATLALVYSDGRTEGGTLTFSTTSTAAPTAIRFQAVNPKNADFSVRVGTSNTVYNLSSAALGANNVTELVLKDYANVMATAAAVADVAAAQSYKVTVPGANEVKQLLEPYKGISNARADMTGAALNPTVAGAAGTITTATSGFTSALDGAVFSLRFSDIDAAGVINTVTGWYVKEDGTEGTFSLGTNHTITAAAGAQTINLILTNADGTSGGTANATFTTGTAASTFANGSIAWEDIVQTSAATDLFSVEVGESRYNLSRAAVGGRTLTLTDYHDYSHTSPTLNATLYKETFNFPNANDILSALDGTLDISVGPVTYKATGSGNTKNTAFSIVDTYSAGDSYIYDKALLATLFDIPASDLNGGNVDLNFEVTARNPSVSLDLKITGSYWDENGEKKTLTEKTAQLTAAAGATVTLDNGNRVVFKSLTAAGSNWVNATPANGVTLTVGDKFSAFYSEASSTADMSVTVTGSDGSELSYNFNSQAIQRANALPLTRTVFDKFGDATAVGASVIIPEGFSVVQIGDIATLDTKLRDIEKFWNSEGRFLLADAQTLTVTQGDGKQTKIVLYGDDTVGELVTKLNGAIADDFGQGKYVGVDSGNFVNFTDESTAAANSARVSNGGDIANSVAGTVIIRSVISGNDGKISFAGDEDLIKALSMNILPGKEARESNYDVTITDAHTGKVTAEARITGNKLIGLVHENVDVIFDAMTGVTASYNAETGFFEYNETVEADTFLHLADNTTVYQIGANEGEDMGVNIGDMRAEALGLEKVLVTDREAAARSITIIDSAIDKISMQRAKLGAYQNRLEHTITNLTVAGENLTAAESRIRDTDMAKEMMNFTKLQIMLQAGTSMLAQANSLPQNVLSLLR